jgi:hypothetical protein
MHCSWLFSVPGTANARVLVGSANCPLTAQNDSAVACVLPPGRTTLNQLLVIQSSGRMFVSDVSTVAVSYAQCQPGQADTGFECETCPVNTFSATSSSPECVTCAPGYVGNNGTGLSSCLVCTMGSYWSAGQCVPCAPGFFSAANASLQCASCPSGKYRFCQLFVVVELRESMRKFQIF